MSESAMFAVLEAKSIPCVAFVCRGGVVIHTTRGISRWHALGRAVKWCERRGETPRVMARVMSAHRKPGPLIPPSRTEPGGKHKAGVPIVRHAWAPHSDGFDPTCDRCQEDAERAHIITQRGIEWSAK